jgi:hypothetical protein
VAGLFIAGGCLALCQVRAATVCQPNAQQYLPAAWASCIASCTWKHSPLTTDLYATQTADPLPGQTSHRRALVLCVDMYGCFWGTT